MDSFAVSATNGMTIKGLTFWKAVAIASIFTFFQGLFPVLGWYAGISVESYIILDLRRQITDNRL